MKKRWNLKGKKALVTGASKGIGKSIADDFRELGADVFPVSRNYSGKDGMKCDVTSAQDRQKLAKKIEAMWGKLDILVNNAGSNNRKQILEAGKADYDEMVELNMTSVYELCRMLHPFLIRSGDASVVNIVSVAGFTSVGTGPVYAMAKAAVTQLTKYLAVNWAGDNIRVNAVAPWYIMTPLTERYVKTEEYLNKILARTPLKRIGKPEEVAAAVSFLSMPAASYITGECISVDGGFLKYGFSIQDPEAH